MTVYLADYVGHLPEEYRYNCPPTCCPTIKPPTFFNHDFIFCWLKPTKPFTTSHGTKVFNSVSYPSVTDNLSAIWDATRWLRSPSLNPMQDYVEELGL